MPDMKQQRSQQYIWFIWELGKKKKEGKKKKPQLNNTHWEKARGEKRKKRKKRGNPEAEAKGASGQPLQVVLLPVNKESTNVLFGDTHFSFFSLPKNYYHPSLFKASLLCSAIPLKLLCFSVSFLFLFFSSLFSISFPNSAYRFSSIWRLHKGEGLRFWFLWFCGSCRFQFLFSFS